MTNDSEDNLIIILEEDYGGTGQFRQIKDGQICPVFDFWEQYNKKTNIEYRFWIKTLFGKKLIEKSSSEYYYVLLEKNILLSIIEHIGPDDLRRQELATRSPIMSDNLRRQELATRSPIMSDNLRPRELDEKIVGYLKNLRDFLNDLSIEKVNKFFRERTISVIQNIEILKIFIDCGLDLKQNANSLIIDSISYHRKVIIKYLFEKHDIGSYIVNYPINNIDFDMLTFLIELGVKIDFTRIVINPGDNNCIEKIRIMKENGIDVSLICKNYLKDQLVNSQYDFINKKQRIILREFLDNGVNFHDIISDIIKN